MKNKSIYLKIAIILAIVTILSVAMCIYVSTAETSAEDLNIAYCNLSFENDTHIMYAIKSSNSKVQLLVWTEPQAEYLLGTQKASVSPLSEQMTIDGEKYTVFKYTGVAAKQMTDNVYVRACIDNGDGDIIYGQAHKYSILQYAYNKLGKTGEATSNQNLIDMLDSMLLYGASAQKYHGYKTDNLATDDFVQIKLSGGILADDFNHGLYKVGTTVTISAPTQSQDGAAFSQWTDKNGTAISDTAEYTLTVGNENNTYTAEYAAIPEYSVGLTYVSNGDGTCYVSGIGTCTDTDINIPPVSPEGDRVVKIGSSAFASNTKLTSISIPENVISIGERAFDTCLYIGRIYLPSSLNEIGTMAFAYCPRVESVSVSPDNTKYSVSGNCIIDNTTGTVCFGGLGAIIPQDENITTIGSCAFIGQSQLTDIEIPNNIKLIGEYAFQDCNNLKDLSIGSGVTQINKSAFLGCFSLESVVIPSNVKTLEKGAFSTCTNLTEIVLYEGLETIGDEAFALSGKVTNVTIPSSVTYLGACAFAHSTIVTVDEANSKYTSYGNYVVEADTNTLVISFDECTDWVQIVVEEDIATVGDMAFYDFGTLEYVALPENVTSIGNQAFEYCDYLLSITLGGNVTSIGERAFFGCERLQVIHFNGTMEQWENISKGTNWNKGADLLKRIECSDGQIAVSS